MVKRKCVLVVVALAALVGTGTLLVRQLSSSSPYLAGIVLSDAPAGFGKGPSSVNGPLSRQDAARATPIGEADVARFLTSHPLRDGYSRVWTAQRAFVTQVALRFRTDADARAMQDFLQQQFAYVAPSYMDRFDDIPGGLSYVYNLRQSNGKYQLCSGVLFTVGPIVQLVSGCGDDPPDQLALQARARAQYARTKAQAHATASGTGPKAGSAIPSESMTLQ